jgi:hypothetical protein
MALHITGKNMRGTATSHTASATPGGWAVTWLPGRVLTQAQAVSAMQIAEVVEGPGALQPGDRRWNHLEGWAHELGLTGPSALVQVVGPLLADDEPERGQS